MSMWWLLLLRPGCVAAAARCRAPGDRDKRRVGGNRARPPTLATLEVTCSPVPHACCLMAVLPPVQAVEQVRCAALLLDEIHWGWVTGDAGERLGWGSSVLEEAFSNAR